MTSKQLRQLYLDFFKSKGHAILLSASLIPENDPTVLFTTAGMHPLVPYLMGEKHPEGVRLASCQKCIRTGDIEEVGDATHHTFFEMLGNWSLGDYFKKEAIEWSFEFLTDKKWLGLDKNRLAVSVFAGDEDAPFDREAFDIWRSLGVSEKRIAKLPKKNNWWGPAGETGPCGPDTEMFYWTGDPDNAHSAGSVQVPDSFNDDHPSWVEIWNDVFMQFNKKADGTYEPLAAKNVDTGMGLERTLAVINGLDDNYQTDLFANIVTKIEELSEKKYNNAPETKKAMRIVADHLKAATFIMGDDKGVAPSNKDHGYVVRKLIRRAVRYGRGLGITKESWAQEVAQVVVSDFQDIYPELGRNSEKIIKEISEEEEKFGKTLEQGLKECRKLFDLHRTLVSVSPSPIHGTSLFNLYQTYGFPPEMAFEEMEVTAKNLKYNLSLDKEKISREFQEEFKKHQELSQTASAGMFKGGLADASDETKKLHTAAHLMMAALRKVLGEHVHQKGSNITPERLRFDFSYGEKITKEQIEEVEKIVNEAIQADASMGFEEMTLEEARNAGAEGVFESKYGEKVKVYTAQKDGRVFSREICGGPHVSHTGALGTFRIVKEEASSAGVRRIKAALE